MIATNVKPCQHAPRVQPAPERQTPRQRLPLFEQYRPRQWHEVVGQPKALERIATLSRRGLSGRAWWVSGLSGSGKTSIARLIAAEVATDENTEEIDAKQLTAARLADIERQANNYRLGSKPGAAYIVNEAHGLTRAVILQLLTTLERIPGHVVWVFTTTRDGQGKLFDEQIDAGPLTSRCVQLPLSATDLTIPFAQRAKEIAAREGLDGQPIEHYIRLVQKHGCNMRAVLNDVEAGAML